MKLLVEFSHPAQVHKFKYALRQLQAAGVEILVLSRDKDVMLELLDGLGLRHRCISKARQGLVGMAWELLVREWRTLLQALAFRPQLMLSAHSVAITHVGWLLQIPRLVHEDTEFGTIQQRLYMPFATKVLTTESYFLDWGPKQLRIPSLEPLAYLHPRYFTPNPDRLQPYGLEPGKFAVLRLIAWRALHDRGLKGLTGADVRSALGRLRAMGYDKVVLSSEQPWSQKEGNSIVFPAASDLHHMLAYAGLCVSESITVANEAAVLGTPSLLVNSLQAGHTRELEHRGLVERYPSLQGALKRASELSRSPGTRQRWLQAQRLLLDETKDMTEAFVEIIANELGLHGWRETAAAAASDRPAPGKGGESHQPVRKGASFDVSPPES